LKNIFDKSFRQGCLKGTGIPGISLCASFFALGAVFKNAGLDAFQSFLSTLIAFALPGQVVMAETLIVEGALLNVFLAVLLTNARLYPMTVNLIPVVRQEGRPKWHYYVLSHFIAVTSWVHFLANYEKIKKEDRFNFFLGFSSTLWFLSVIATIIGFYVAGVISKKIFIALIFLNPIYFLCMVVSNLETKHIIFTVIFSFILSPILFLLSPQWSVVIAGLVAGIVAYLIFIHFK